MFCSLPFQMFFLGGEAGVEPAHWRSFQSTVSHVQATKSWRGSLLLASQGLVIVRAPAGAPCDSTAYIICQTNRYVSRSPPHPCAGCISQKEASQIRIRSLPRWYFPRPARLTNVSSLYEGSFAHRAIVWRSTPSRRAAAAWVYLPVGLMSGLSAAIMVVSILIFTTFVCICLQR